MPKTSFSMLLITLVFLLSQGFSTQAQVKKPYKKKPVKKVKSVEAWKLLHPEKRRTANSPIDIGVDGAWLMIGLDHKPYRFRLYPDGSYKTTCGYKTVETGTMKAKNGKWSISSKKGRKDSGTYTIDKTFLTLYSPTTMVTKWRRTKIRKIMPGTEHLERNRKRGFSSTYGGYNEYGGKNRLGKKKFPWSK